MKYVKLLSLLTLVAVLASGCAKPVHEEETSDIEEISTVAESDYAAADSGLSETDISETSATDMYAEEKQVELKRIHFAFDKHDLDTMARQNLQNNALYLEQNPATRIVLEGHCDERGSDEYNLALGERRARAAAEYLINLGINSSRIKTISYGEEKPLDPASNEDAWALNRRAEFKPQQ